MIQPWGDTGVDVLACGHLPPNPSELLGNEAMGSLLELLQSRYDFVVVDAPPLLAVTDAVILARHCGGAIVVVSNHGRRTVTRQQLVEALDNLEAGGTRALGVVFRGCRRGARTRSRSASTDTVIARSGQPAARRRTAPAAEPAHRAERARRAERAERAEHTGLIRLRP